ncbi:MAG: DUF1489 family protein [Alphaproteobacteria bacterium]
MSKKDSKNNIKKLCVGVETVEQLEKIQQQTFKTLGYGCAYTTMRPTKEEVLIKRGSLYWIIKGKISARQKILGFEQYIDNEGKKRTLIKLDKNVIETEKHSHRPFQGWRYLADKDIPKDIDKSKYAHIDSSELEKLRDLGIL